MTIPQHPLNPAWLAIEIKVVGYCLIDSWEAAAMKALTTFCEQHPLEVILAPARLFLAVSESHSGCSGLPKISGRLIQVIINSGFENCYPKLYPVF
jgi:hypothetical protein